MTQSFDVEALIKLRSQTRAISDALKAQAADYLATVAPLIRPQTLFGEYLQGAQRSSGRETQGHFQALVELYERIGSAAPFQLVTELEVPLNLISTTPNCSRWNTTRSSNRAARPSVSPALPAG